MPYKLNYKFQSVDSRDYKFQAKAPVKVINSFLVSRKINTILDQGYLGSCVSCVFAQNINMVTQKINMSRLMHYYCGRAIEESSSLDDVGLEIRKAAGIISKYGVCLESVWPYDVTKFNQLPPLTAFKQSNFFRKYTYSFVNQDLNSLKTCLVSTNSPIIFGINVYSSFMTDKVTKTGIVPMPDTSSETLLGGHCILMIGYNDVTQCFTCLNSWGKGWGANGLFYLPYLYVTDPNLAADFCSLNFIY